MSVIPTVFAVVEMQDALAQWRKLGVAAQERLIVLTAITLITVPVVVWAVYFRKSRRRPHGHQHSHHHSYEPAKEAAADTSDDPEQPGKRRKWRRPRREHRPRNPTLAETGGLPPVRTGEPPEILP